MDDIQARISSLYALYATHSSTIARITSFINQANRILTSTLYPPLSRLASNLSTNPDVASVLLLLALLFVSMKLLGILYRTVLFWVRLALRLAFWAAVLGVGLWVWTRGVDGVAGDLVELGRVWGNEYAYWSERSDEARDWFGADGGRTGAGDGGYAGVGGGYRAYGRGRGR